MIEKDLFWRRLSILVKKTGKSFNGIERELGYPRNAIHNYRNGGEPSGTRLIEISDYFNVSPEYLIGKSAKMTITTKELFKNMSLRQKIEIGQIYQEWIKSLMNDEIMTEPLEKKQFSKSK